MATYLTYVVSFMTIGVIWVNHHALVGLLSRVDRPQLFLNLLLLMTVSLCSFSTAILSQWILSESEAHVVAAVDGLVFMPIALSFLSAPASLIVYAAVSAYYFGPVLPKPIIHANP